jgi:predicted  nucleic acid-binding Zn-ribbon protein|tara:strand:+ start:336 stop:677 length:342 start_codon:yes stop_codon:yes gene_type:complete
MKDTDWKKKCQDLENEMVLIKGITITNSPELREANKKIKELENRMAELLTVEDEHQKLNGKLQMKLTELEDFNIRVRQEVTAKEQENLELHADNRKLAKQIEEQLDRLRKGGM